MSDVPNIDDGKKNQTNGTHSMANDTSGELDAAHLDDACRVAVVTPDVSVRLAWRVVRRRFRTPP